MEIQRIRKLAKRKTCGFEVREEETDTSKEVAEDKHKKSVERHLKLMQLGVIGLRQTHVLHASDRQKKDVIGEC